ncbi:glycosyltransferase family 52 [Ornithobacterium rhinotracheale]
MIKEKNILIFNSLYSLLIYLIYKDLEDIKDTLYITAEQNVSMINPNLGNIKTYKSRHLKPLIKLHPRINYLQLLIEKYAYYQYLRLKKLFNYKFPKNAKIYTHDYSIESSAMIGNSKYFLLEEGTMNFIDYKITFSHLNERHLKLQRLLFGNISGNFYAKNNQIIEKIYTRKDKDENIKTKVVNLKKIWNESPMLKKEFILNIFNLNSELQTSMKSIKNIVFTQPLNEDSILSSEEEKINIYKKAIDFEGQKNIIIKTHPREKTNYKEYFPEVTIINQPIPMEFFSIIGLKFKKAYTVFSSAAMNLNYPIEIIQLPTHRKLIEEENFKKLIK